MQEPNKLIPVFKALSNETRLNILQWLKEPERYFPHQKMADVREVGVCVKLIQSKAGLSQSTVSQYLALMQKAGLVKVTRVGQWTYYKRNDATLSSLAKHITEEL